MITLVAWVNWLISRQTEFHGLTYKNLERMRYTIQGPDYVRTITMDIIVVCAIVLIWAGVKAYKLLSSEETKS